MDYITAKQLVENLQIFANMLDGFSYMYDDHLPIDDNPVYNDFNSTLKLVNDSLNRLRNSIDDFQSKIVSPTLF